MVREWLPDLIAWIGVCKPRLCRRSAPATASSIVLTTTEVMKMYAQDGAKLATREQNHAEKISSAINCLAESVRNFEQFVSLLHGSEKGIPAGSNNPPTPIPSYHDILLRSPDAIHEQSKRIDDGLVRLKDLLGM